jgi:hypothetical protein
LFGVVHFGFGARRVFATEAERARWRSFRVAVMAASRAAVRDSRPPASTRRRRSDEQRCAHRDRCRPNSFECLCQHPRHRSTPSLVVSPRYIRKFRRLQ